MAAPTARRTQFIPAWARQPRRRVHTPCQVEPELWFARGANKDAKEACSHCPLRLQCLDEAARAASERAAGRGTSACDPAQRADSPEGWAPTHGVWAGHRMPGLVANRLETRYEELNDDLRANGMATYTMPTTQEISGRAPSPVIDLPAAEPLRIERAAAEQLALPIAAA